MSSLDIQLTMSNFFDEKQDPKNNAENFLKIIDPAKHICVEYQSYSLQPMFSRKQKYIYIDYDMPKYDYLMLRYYDYKEAPSLPKFNSNWMECYWWNTCTCGNIKSPQIRRFDNLYQGVNSIINIAGMHEKMIPQLILTYILIYIQETRREHYETQILKYIQANSKNECSKSVVDRFCIRCLLSVRYNNLLSLGVFALLNKNRREDLATLGGLDVIRKKHITIPNSKISVVDTGDRNVHIDSIPMEYKAFVSELKLRICKNYIKLTNHLKTFIKNRISDVVSFGKFIEKSSDNDNHELLHLLEINIGNSTISRTKDAAASLEFSKGEEKARERDILWLGKIRETLGYEETLDGMNTKNEILTEWADLSTTEKLIKSTNLRISKLETLIVSLDERIQFVRTDYVNEVIRMKSIGAQSWVTDPLDFLVQE